ncbi:Ribonuclease H-like domain containing protein [Parasponia andersonii]|uniref:Ribonuclease H-like domain containing protein n=1 Tax=Parasponia andersonii TaxID=3476 RepID=A0A2P5DCI6_PARAD|nr:Ribonuclease H-like domain containing protein [Parasponia andersonii]
MVFPCCLTNDKTTLHAITFGLFAAEYWSKSPCWIKMLNFKSGRGRCRSDTELLKDAGLWLTEYQRLSSVKMATLPINLLASIRTGTTVSGRLKLNVNASTDRRSHLIGVGAIERDDRDQVMGALSKRNYGCFDPFLAEHYAVREGLQFALANNFDNLDIKSDSLNAIFTINYRDELSIAFPLIIDILKLSFLLACWLDETPVCIASLVFGDLSPSI